MPASRQASAILLVSLKVADKMNCGMGKEAVAEIVK